MNDKLTKLKTLIEITNDSLTKQEILDAIQLVINQVLSIETKALEKINQDTQNEKQQLSNLSQEFNQIIEQAKIESDNSLAGFKRKTVELINSLFAKSQVNQKLSVVLENASQKLQELDNKMTSIKNGLDGKNGIDGKDGKDAVVDENKIIQEVLNKIELPELIIDNIKGLREVVDRVETQRRLGGGGFSKIHMESKFIDDETPSGLVNNVNTIFTLAHHPNPESSLKVFVNGQRMRITEDYTLSGNTVTFLTAPPTGSILLVDYRK